VGLFESSLLLVLMPQVQFQVNSRLMGSMQTSGVEKRSRGGRRRGALGW
jgi:hypothetical protein